MSTYPSWTKRGKGVAPHYGVAPLGLEPVGRWFVDQLLPDVTNGTAHVRYYSFFCWVLRTFLDQVAAGRLERTDQDQQWWLTRMENLFRYATLYADQRDGTATTGLVGISEAAKRPLPVDDPDALVEVGERFAATAFIPANYRASFSALGCAEVEGDVANLTMATGVPLAEAFHQKVLQVPDAGDDLRILLTPSETVPMRVIAKFADAIRLRGVPPEDSEHPLLVNLLFRTEHARQRQDLARGDRQRSHTLALLLDILDRSGEPLHPKDFHGVFASGRLPSGENYGPPAPLADTWTTWRRYQEREFERVALYSLLYVIVPEIHVQKQIQGGATTRSLVAAVLRQAAGAPLLNEWGIDSLSSLSVAGAMDLLRERLDTSGRGPERSIEPLARRVMRSKDAGEIAAGSLLLFLLVLILWQERAPHQPSWARRMHEHGGEERLSLATAGKDLELRRSESLADFAAWLIEGYVLSQTFRVAMQKLAAGDFRFFLAMGDDGYEVVKDPPDGRLYYPPRISPMFRMLAELHLLSADDDGRVMPTGMGVELRDKVITSASKEASAA